MLRWPVSLAAAAIVAACGDSARPIDRSRTGATEVILAFRTGEPPGTFTTPEPALVRGVLVELGQRDIEIERLQYRVADAMRPALLVRVAPSEWPPAAVREAAVAAIRREYGAATLRKAAWAGNRIFLRTTAPTDEVRLRALLTALDLGVGEMRTDHEPELGEYNTQIDVGGTDVAIERALEKRVPGTDVVVADALAVGPTAR